MKITFVGGDARMDTVARLLQHTGACEVYGYGMAGESVPAATTLHEAVAGAEALILPLPATRDGIHPTTAPGITLPPLLRIFSRAEEECLLLCGMPSPALRAAAGELEVCDYYAGETILSKNAYATAEAAVAMAALDLPRTLAGCTVAILGAGRIALCLLPLLRAMGAHVLLYARSAAAREKAEAAGAVVFALEEGRPPVFPDLVRVIFSTVPAPLFPPGAPLPKRGTLFYDLGGGALDPTVAKSAGIILPPSAGLPGRYSPESAGQYIFREITYLLETKRGVTF